MSKLVTFYATCGTIHKVAVGEMEYEDDEFENAVDSGEIYADGEEFAREVLEVTYVVEEAA